MAPTFCTPLFSCCCDSSFCLDWTLSCSTAGWMSFEDPRKKPGIKRYLAEASDTRLSKPEDAAVSLPLLAGCGGTGQAISTDNRQFWQSSSLLVYLLKSLDILWQIRFELVVVCRAVLQTVFHQNLEGRPLAPIVAGHSEVPCASRATETWIVI